MPRTELEFAQVDDNEYASQQELDQVKDNNTTNFVASTMNNWELWQRLGGNIGNARVFPVTAARNATITNTYLRSDGVSTKTSPIVLPFDCALIAIGASTKTNATWKAQVRLGNSLVTGAQLQLTAAQTGYSTAFTNINFLAGDAVQLYCKGSSVVNPRIVVYFERGTTP